MAVPSREEVLRAFIISTHESRRAVMFDNFFKSATLLKILRARSQVKTDGSKRLTSNFIYAKFSGGSYGRGKTFNTAVTDFSTQMSFDWKFLYAPINLDTIDIELNDSENKIFDIVEKAMVNGELSLQEDLGTQMFLDGTGNSGLDIDGLANGVSRTGTYGGITRGSTGPGAAIRAAFEDSTGGNVSLAAFNANFGKARIAGERPDLIMTTQPVWDRLWERTSPAERFRAEGNREIGFGGDLTFNRALVEEDSHQAAGTAHFLNTNFWTFYVHKKWDFRLRGPKEPTNQQRSISQLIVYCNLINDAPRLNGVMTGLTE